MRVAAIINLLSRFVRRKRTTFGFLAILALGAWGCRGRIEGFERYIPAPGPARAAVVAVLDAWREGRPPEAGVGPKSDVHVVDKHRLAGQRLLRYEVLGEVTTEKARGFAVRLTLESPDEQKMVRFLAVGVEPIWVFRQEDFEMISHWMHPMDDVKGEPAPRVAPVEKGSRP